MPDLLKLSSPQTSDFWQVPILYRDEHLLAVDKPRGLALAADPEDPERPNLLSLLHAGIASQKPWAVEHGLSFLTNVHRIDSEASGILVLARHKQAQLKLADWFGAGKPGRNYVALVEGLAESDQFAVEGRLALHPTRHNLVVVDPKRGKAARTRFEVLERFRNYTLLKCDALIDRRHQVRSHLRHVRLPVVGDRAYGGKPLLLSRLKPGYQLKPDQVERPLLSTPGLHADRLTLPHPISGQDLSITSEWPKDLNVALKYLRRFDAREQ